MPSLELNRTLPPRRGLLYFAGELGFNRLSGYSHDLRQRGFAIFCNPHVTKRRDCTPVAYDKNCDCECRKDIPQNCSLWRDGVTIQQHSRHYHEDLMEHTFCIAWPGDGWSSRVLDAVVHGCIPVIVQDDSHMFFEGVFKAAGFGFDYEDFSVRIAEAEQHKMLDRLSAISLQKIGRMQQLILRIRDFFVYKDMYNPNSPDRHSLLGMGQPGYDAFLLLTKALEVKARATGIDIPISKPLFASGSEHVQPSKTKGASFPVV